MIDNLTTFVSSSDAYEDCWQPFFFLLKKHWPTCDLPIVLNTEGKRFAFPGLDITCTCAGRQQGFGETFRKGLEFVKTDNILLVMIDYFVMEDVNSDRLSAAYKTFIEEQLDALTLVQMTSITETVPLREGVRLVAGPGRDRFSFQTALWRKESIKKYVLSHETPWMAECFGSQRYKYSKDRIAFLEEGLEPIKYLHTGALHQGGWMREIVPFLEESGITLDWKKRGYYQRKKPSLLERVNSRRKTAAKEVMSRLHLLGLKAGVIRPD
jgi:hypothetical protein